MTVDRLHEDMGEPEAVEPQPPVEESVPEERAAILAAVPEVMMEPDASEPEPAEAEFEVVAGPIVMAESSDAAEPIAFPEYSGDVTIWPFVAYVGVWAAFAGFVVWQLLEVPRGTAVYESAVYPLTLFGGLVLTAAGPLLIVVSWLSEKGRSSSGSAPVFFSSLMRGSTATLTGVALWWIALLMVDQIRLGRLL